MNKPGDYRKLNSRELDAAVHRRVFGEEPQKLAAASADGGKSFACVEHPLADLFSQNTQRKHVEQFCREHPEYKLVDYEHCPHYSQSLSTCWLAVMAMSRLESEGKLGAFWHNQWSQLTHCRAQRKDGEHIALSTPDSTHIRHAKEEHVCRFLCERMLEALDVGNPSMSEVLDSFKELGKGVDWEAFDKQEREDEIASLKASIKQAQDRLAELEAAPKLT